MTNDSLNFQVTLDDTQARAQAQALSAELRRIGQSAQSSGAEMDAALRSSASEASATATAFASLGQTLAATFGTTALLGFARSVLQVRADMQGLEASFTTLLGSGQKAQQMLSELTRFGAETPMDLSDLARASQTMLSFGIQGEKIVPLIRQLGDISGGSGDKLQSLALAFSQMSSTGRLMGQDLNQMINAGFNPLSEIARTTGRSMAELKEAMEAGAISIDMVEGALRSATSQGGLFFGNLDAQSKTLRGQLGALSDAYEQMLNQIGQQTEGALSSGIGLATAAVEHWQTLAKAIFATASAVGAYKAVLIATVALDRVRNASAWIAEARSLESLIGAQGVALVQKQGLTIGTQAYTLALRQQFVAQQAALGVTVTEAQLTSIATAAKGAETAATGLLTTAKNALTAATTRLYAVMAANPYALAAAAVALLAYGIYELVTYESEAEASARKLKESHAEATREFEGEKLVLKDLYDSLQSAKAASDDTTKSQKEHNEALASYQQKKEELIRKAPQAVSALVKERLEVDDLAGAYKILTDEVRKSIMARHREQAIKELGDASFEKNKEVLLRLRTNLHRAYGEQLGDKKLQEIRSTVDSGKGINPAFIKQVKETLKKRYGEGAGLDFGSLFASDLKKLSRAHQEQEKSLQEINALYGRSQVTSAKTTAALGDVSQAATKALESYNKAKQRLSDLRSGKTPVKQGSEAKAIEEAKKEMEAQAKAYETLTGKSLTPKASRGGAGGKSSANPNHAIAERKQQAIDLKLLEEKNAQDEAARQLRQQEERLGLMQEGWQKEEALLALNAEKRKAAYAKMERDLLEAQRAEARKRWEQQNPKAKDKGEVFDPTTITAKDLGQDAQRLLTEQARLHREQEIQEQEAYWRKAIEGAESYEQRRLKIQQDYARRREALYQHDEAGQRTTLRQGASQDNVAELDRKESDALTALDLEIAQRSESFKAWMESIASLSLDQLASALESAKEELAKLQSAPGISATDLASAQARVSQLQKALSKATAREAIAPSSRSVRDWKALSDMIDKSTKSFDELGSAIGGTAGKLLKSVGSIASTTIGAINSIVQLTQASASAMTATASGASAAMKTVEKASVILSVISAAFSVAQTIASLFNSDADRDQEIKHLQARIDALQWEIDHVSTLRLERVLPASQALQRAFAEARQEVKLMAGDVFGLQTYLRRSELAAQKLAATYEKINYSANKAVGSQRFHEARAQLKAMSEQQIALQRQIGAEQGKKKTDYGKIDEYRRKIAELGEKQAEVINKLTEDVLGGDFAKLSAGLGDALSDAFLRGENAADAWGEKVADIMRDIVKRQLTEQLIAKPMLELYDKYKAKFSEALFEPEAIIGLTSSLTRDMKAIGDRVIPAYGAAIKTLQGELAETLGAGESARQATKRGIATASQESVDENNGLLRSIQGLTAEIQTDLRSLRSVASDQLRHLARIDEHTAHLAAMSDDLRSLRSDLADIQTRGVRIKS